MNLRDEWRERVAEALPCTPRCYPATRSGHSNGCTRSRHTTADQLLAPGGVVAGIVAEVVKDHATAIDIMFEHAKDIGRAEVRAQVEALAARYEEWTSEFQPDLHPLNVARDLREALKTAQNPPSDGRARSGEGAGPSDGAEGVERGEG